MPYTYILDDSIKSPTLILTLITQLSYFSQVFFLQNKELLFSSVSSVGEPLHEHAHIFA